MIRQSGERLIVEGALTNSTVADLVEAGRGALRSGASVVDLGGVTHVDSAAIALLLDWTRAADRPLDLRNVPEGFHKLARLYGVDELLPAGDNPGGR